MLGIPGTASAAVAAATFGMVAGTVLGAPVGERIIKMHKVKHLTKILNYLKMTVST